MLEQDSVCPLMQRIAALHEAQGLQLRFAYLCSMLTACCLIVAPDVSQLGWPDMRLPILYTMSWPERVPCSEATWPRLDFVKMATSRSGTPIAPSTRHGPGLRGWPRGRHHDRRDVSCK